MDFYELANEVHKDRIKEEQNQRNNLNYQANLEYNLFCVWCRAFKKAQFTEQNFKEYVRTEKDLNFWVKKKIFELFFGYEFEFNYYSNKWNCREM